MKKVYVISALFMALTLGAYAAESCNKPAAAAPKAEAAQKAAADNTKCCCDKAKAKESTGKDEAIGKVKAANEKSEAAQQ